jgi:hypothetical protein
VVARVRVGHAAAHVERMVRPEANTTIAEF